MKNDQRRSTSRFCPKCGHQDAAQGKAWLTCMRCLTLYTPDGEILAEDLPGQTHGKEEDLDLPEVE